MWALHRKGSGVAREDHSLGIKIKRPVDVRKALEQPAAEEAGATCNEDALVSHLLPERPRFVEDMVKVGGGQRLLCHRLDPLFSQISEWYSQTEPGKRSFVRANIRLPGHYSVRLPVSRLRLVPLLRTEKCYVNFLSD